MRTSDAQVRVDSGTKKMGQFLLRTDPLIHWNKMVGVAGFELATPCTPCKCATRLRYTATRIKLYRGFQALSARSSQISNDFLRSASSENAAGARRRAVACRER